MHATGSLRRLVRSISGRSWTALVAGVAVVAALSSSPAVAAGAPRTRVAASGASVSPGPASSPTSTTALTPAQQQMRAGASVGVRGPAISPGAPRPVGGSSGGGGASRLATTGSPTVLALSSMLNLPQVTPSPAADRPAMAYDSARRQVVRFGGCTSGSVASCTAFSSQTWRFNGDTWTQYTGSGPSARGRRLVGVRRGDRHVGALRWEGLGGRPGRHLDLERVGVDPVHGRYASLRPLRPGRGPTCRPRAPPTSSAATAGRPIIPTPGAGAGRGPSSARAPAPRADRRLPSPTRVRRRATWCSTVGRTPLGTLATRGPSTGAPGRRSPCRQRRGRWSAPR